MSRVQLLGRGQERPRYCQACAQYNKPPHFFMGNGGDYPIILKWLVDRHGRVLWYFYCCEPCYRRLPPRTQALAIEPPDELRPPSAAHPWFGDLPVSPPPRRYAAAGRR